MKIIAGNSQHTGNKNRGYAESWTSEQLDGLLSEDWLRKMVSDIRAGNEKLKEQLPYICPHYAAFRNNHRAQKDILPETFTFITCVDVDDKALVQKAIEQALAVNGDAYSDWQDQVLRIEYSARKKVHIYIRIPKGMTIEEAQLAFCKEIDVPYDESCITPERFIYVTGRDEEVYRSPHWLEPLSEEELSERREAYLNRGLDVDGQPLKMDDGRGKKEEGRGKKDDDQPSAINLQTSTARTRFIFEQCMKEAEVEPRFLIEEGARHNSLKSILSVGATQLLTQEELMGVLKEMMPQNWQDQNVRQLVSDFYRNYTDVSRRMTSFERKVFARSMKMTDGKCQVDDGSEKTSEVTSTNQSELSRIFASQTPPVLPDILPRLVKVVTSRTPQKYKGTVAQAMFPPLGAYPNNLSFVYMDNQLRELRMNCLIVAETGSGKDTCMKQPLQHILADMKERDKVNRKRLKDFNEEYNSKENDKRKPQRPDDLVIQNIKSDITKAALVQRMDEAQGAPLYVRLNELEQWDKIEGATGRNNQFTTLKLCDDEQNDFGSDRASTQSVTGDGSLHLNWNANTTIPKLLRYFRNVMTDGPISRLCLATIPKDEIGADIEVFGSYDEKYDEALKPYIDNLKAATGTVDCQQARRMIRRLKDECDEFSRLSGDGVFDNLTHRALVIAFRKACLLYVANGMKWEKSIESFCRWSLFYDLYLKMMLFGDYIRRAEGEVQVSKRGPQSLLDYLSEEFTVEDVVRVRQKLGLNASPKEAAHMIRTWKSRGYCAQSTEHSFCKTLNKA